MADLDTTTIGVAIDVPEPYARELRDWRERSGDPQAKHVPPHVTLLPPTQVPATALPEIADHLAGVAALASAFEMHLRGTGTFRPVSEVVFIVVAAGIAQCERLERAVRSGALARPTQFPYHPHVTVAHGVPTERLDLVYEGLTGFDARFKVAEFTMFTQDGAGIWQPQRRYPLGA
ncbi:MAG: 2'-5' RNA ligase family protein [Actinobacteria bacterium]|nr:2'-5' RNA ligase family protein [Actinomycetota bacterium]MBI3687444.1 2'-5' RNA ligase family protein [Actinomycetota bacterium]